MSYFIRNLGHVDTYPNIYENGDFFFSVLAFCPPVSSVFRHPKSRFSKTVPRVELFLNRQLIVCVNKREQGFSNTVMS